MRAAYRIRRIVAVLVIFIGAIVGVIQTPNLWQGAPNNVTQPAPAARTDLPAGDAADALKKLEIKGRAPKTGYARAQFGDGWARQGACDMRNIILNRDLAEVSVDDTCKVQRGVLNDPYSGAKIDFVRGPQTSDDVQIDHVVALSDAWQKGAQQLTRERRVEFANDPLNLLAVEGKANQDKSDADAATWLPSNKAFRCQYVARQVAVKAKYALWVTQAEHDAMARVLQECPGQQLPAGV